MLWLTAQSVWIYLWSTSENLPLDSVLWLCPKCTQVGIIHVFELLMLSFGPDAVAESKSKDSQFISCHVTEEQ